MLRKSVIISGGFGDIGKATAEKFAQNGFNVALTYYQTIDQEFIEKIKGYGVEILAIRCDQTSESNVRNFVNSAFSEFEFIDAAILCAGKAESEGFLTEKSTDMISDIIDVNFKGTILFCREVLKHFMTQKHGNIVVISSLYGEMGGSLESVYSACKAGLNGLVKSLAVECAPNIRINALAPGFIDTKMNSKYDQEVRKFVINQTPLARLGKPEDVANASYFLATDESSFITGEVITISGGAKQL